MFNDECRERIEASAGLIRSSDRQLLELEETRSDIEIEERTKG